MAKFNIGRLYFRDYYKNIFVGLHSGDYAVFLRDRKFPDSNDEPLVNKDLKGAELELIPKPIPQLNSLNAKILYPGLITGVGLEHDVKIQQTYKLGMHFDYTMGMPVVYGSSVKGVLRAYFKEYCRDIRHLDDKTINELFEKIFNGKNPTENVTLPKNERVIFFDAVIVSVPEKQHLLEEDAITPHNESCLKNPIPIMMLKIAPGCEIQFRFLVPEIYRNNNILDIFKGILGTVGVGAKTNVGYGQLEF